MIETKRQNWALYDRVLGPLLQEMPSSVLAEVKQTVAVEGAALKGQNVPIAKHIAMVCRALAEALEKEYA